MDSMPGLHGLERCRKDIRQTSRQEEQWKASKNQMKCIPPFHVCTNLFTGYVADTWVFWLNLVGAAAVHHGATCTVYTVDGSFKKMSSAVAHSGQKWI